MTSREIAELTGKMHQDVLRDVRRMLEDLDEDGSKFAGIYLDAYQREKPCFNLPKDLTLTLVAGYSVPLRHRIVTRWMELSAAGAAGGPGGCGLLARPVSAEVEASDGSREGSQEGQNFSEVLLVTNKDGQDCR